MSRAKGLLTVTVVRGSDLPKMDFLGSTDPFVQLTLAETAIVKEPQQAKTQVADDGKNPVWNEKVPFTGIMGGEVVKLEVYDEDSVGKADLVGTADLKVPTDRLDSEQLIDEWINVTSPKGEPAGKLFIILHYIPITVLEHLQKKFNKQTADAKGKMVSFVVNKVTDYASAQIKGAVAVEP
ncbi:hypothetical protein HK097_004691 [Rhizophlyctis rosea]|uniref:C2 domain-containing protein n=1 Tax=Rhizophlyctis rosea TaxID=64517 RepID=A0AAD5X2Q1_9FUNG|nr:hypothetical protein HK097_004691 [Rhizophlyctis rosea]